MLKRKKIMALLMTLVFTTGMMAMHVSAEAEEIGITELKLNGVEGVIKETEEETWIYVGEFPCGTDLTKLKVEVEATEGAEVILVDDERLDGRSQEGAPLLPEYVNFISPRTFRVMKGEETRDYIVQALIKEHEMSDATCTEPAICKVCGYTEGTSLGHSFGEWAITKESTLTEKGEEARTCTRCGLQETRSMERLNRIADASKNKIDGIEAGKEYSTEGKIAFQAVGAGAENTEPIDGDTRYVPVKWRVGLQNTWKEFSGEASFTLKEAGNYRVHVLFQQQVFQNGEWKATDETDLKEVKFKIAEPKKVDSDKEETKTDETKRAVKTGDKTNGILFILSGMAVMALAAVFMVKRRLYDR